MGCIMNFIDMCPQSYMGEDKVQAILSSVIHALSDGPVIVQEYAIFCIISLCENLRYGFSSVDMTKSKSALPSPNGVSMGTYYDVLMPILKNILCQTYSSGCDGLWGQTFEW